MTDLLPALPKPARRMKQPSKDSLRAHLAAAQAEINRLTALVAYQRLPWWQRLYKRVRSTRKEPS